MTVEAPQASPPPSPAGQDGLEALRRGAAALAHGYDLAQREDEEGARAAYEAALQEFRQARSIDSDLIEAHLGIGRAEYALKRYDQARFSFERARKHGGENGDSLWGLGQALLALAEQRKEMGASDDDVRGL